MQIISKLMKEIEYIYTVNYIIYIHAYTVRFNEYYGYKYQNNGAFCMWHKIVTTAFVLRFFLHFIIMQLQRNLDYNVKKLLLYMLSKWKQSKQHTLLYWSVIWKCKVFSKMTPLSLCKHACIDYVSKVKKWQNLPQHFLGTKKEINRYSINLQWWQLWSWICPLTELKKLF